MQTEEVTIIVPTRNEAQNIGAFLGSLPPMMKLIVVDASEDGTPDIVAALRPHHTLLIHDRSNVTYARQIGGDAAATPWLMFTDADVIFSRNYFARLSTYNDYEALYGPKLSISNYAGYYRWIMRAQRLSDWLGMPAASGSNLLMSKPVFNEVGGFDLRLTCNEDSEIAWRIKRRGFPITFAPDLIVYARDHRRLQRGALRKTLHSVTRCALLYFNLMPDRWRSHDWGYWLRQDTVEKSDGTRRL